MGITLMFMVLGTATPFIFLYLKNKPLAIVQSILLAGMWLYFIQVMFLGVVPAVFSITWIMFYTSLIMSAVGWVMFIINMVNMSEKYRGLTNKEIREI
ncbi:hypothetical protein [Lentibacillus amyloliquefaciens]|uniref:Uncharacterized protein n=1 Tax=Lentibacillus amyloliquefaciens TaxID=1472767 RepID=A0A0U3W6N7_9BACI|nr:hypothetical protein [Lentibacillus amyloliquefaciens]ALX48850.1 hypothetical protein AOX59_09620 [Lentibacillus amyloliquefaciens]